MARTPAAVSVRCHVDDEAAPALRGSAGGCVGDGGGVLTGPVQPGLHPALDLGELPVSVVNAALGTELEPGRVRLSRQAHRHMAKDHPADCAVCLAALPGAVATPSFIGQAPGHGRNFEMLRRIARPDGKVVLVAIGLEPDDAGDYRVRSCYLVGPDMVDARRQAGRLKTVLP